MNKLFLVKRFFLLLIISLLTGYQLNAAVISSFSDSTRTDFYPVRERMLIKSLNGTWKFKFIEGLEIPADYSGWEKPAYNSCDWDDIIVPGNWETQGHKKPEYRWIEECLGLYRTQFKYDKAWKNKQIILRFDGVYSGYECFINGHRVGEWGSAYNLCQFNITPYLNVDGDNILSVMVTTRAMGWEFDKNDCWVIAGITRDVEIFTLDNVYLEDITYVSTVDKNLDATIKVSVDVNRFKTDEKDYRLNIALSDPLNNHVLDFYAPIDPKVKTYDFESIMEDPKLWTAETPNLYRLEVFITNEQGIVVQRANEYVGVRSIYVDGFDLKVNHKPVLLRGVCINEIDPKLGRALTYKERHKLLLQMKDANINYIRTAHYPFGPDFLELCDKMGFYVADEIPFGHGDQFLKDKSYLPELLARAEATVRRDKNHASVIMWTIGNENPYTSMVENVITYVKEKDQTRPRGIPLNAPTFASMLTRQSKNVDIYMGHYLNDARIQQLIDKADKPVIMTEYAHSLGLSFNDLEDKYNRILTEPKLIGGAIWNFQDQAILTDGTSTAQNDNQLHDIDGAFSLPSTSTVTQGVWIDSVRYMDTFGDQGTDGVIYADGYPQEDFFQVRKVYSPAVILTNELQANATSMYEIEIENRFDFISLHGYTMVWKLKNLQNVLDKGQIWLQTDARKKERVQVKTSVPKNVAYNDLMLCFEIQNPEGKAVYEKNIRINRHEEEQDYYSLILSVPANKKYSASASKKGITAKVGDVQYAVSEKGILTISDGKNKLAETPLYLRTSRKVTVTLEYQGLKNKFYWNPYILEPVVEKIVTSKQKDGIEAKLSCKWYRGEEPEQYISGVVAVKILPNGVVRFDYELDPADNTTGNFLELGLTLKLNNSFDTFRWLGNGPYTTTPDKNAFNERGVWHLHKNDLRFIGNRGKVDMGLLTAGQTGIGLWSDSGNLGVENIDGSIYLSQNIFVLSYGNKFSAPQGRIATKELENQKGTLLLFVDQPTVAMDVLEPVFKPYKIIVPEQPYLKSYGW